MRTLATLILLVAVGVAGAVDLDVRHFYVTNDTASAVAAVKPLRWYAGESVKLDLWARRAGVPVDTSASGLFARWEMAATSGVDVLYVCATGTIAATNGYLTFALSPGDANAPTGAYTTHVRLYQPVLGTNHYVGTVYTAPTYVLWAPSATNYVYQGPWANASEIDPTFRSSAAYGITVADTQSWATLAAGAGDISAVTVSGGLLSGGAASGDAVITLTTSAVQAAAAGITNGLQGAGTYATGTPVYAESDPIWAGVSGVVSVGSAAGSQALAWGNHATNGYVTGTVVRVESDPVFTNWAATNAYVKAETDPVWAGASNSFAADVQGRAFAASSTDATAKVTAGTNALNADINGRGYLTAEGDPAFVAWTNDSLVLVAGYNAQATPHVDFAMAFGPSVTVWGDSLAIGKMITIGVDENGLVDGVIAFGSTEGGTILEPNTLWFDNWKAANVTNQTFYGAFIGNGSSVSNINGANITAGTASSNALDAASDSAYRHFTNATTMSDGKLGGTNGVYWTKNGTNYWILLP